MAPHPMDRFAMLRFFVSELQVRVVSIEARVPAERQPLLNEVRRALDAFFTAGPAPAGLAPEAENAAWREAYRLERLLALVTPADALPGEMIRRLDRAAEERVGSAPRLRAAFEAAAPLLIDTASTPPELKEGAEPRLRAMLLDVLEATHRTLQRKFYSRPIQKGATRRLVTFGLVGCALFLAPYIWLAWRSAWADSPAALLERMSWLPLWTAMTAGFFGAMFSRLLYLQANWNSLTLGALEDARESWSILLRGAVGVTGAVVVYFFLLSKVVGGGLFPDFSQINIEAPARQSPGGETPARLALLLPTKDLALLVVWSFLAGFSERLVPGILQQSEGRVASGDTKRAG